MTASLIRKASVQEICGHRAHALQKWAEALAAIDEARAAHERATPHHPMSSMPDLRTSRRADETLERIKLDIDRDVWRSFMVGTKLATLMDQQERTKFEREIADGFSLQDTGERNRWGEPVKSQVRIPEATEANLLATFQRLHGEAGDIFRRGLVNAFSRLSRDYKSNDGFKLGDRIVIEYGVTYDKLGSSRWFSTRNDLEQMFLDVDRVMHILDGKAPPAWGEPGLRSALYGACRDYGETGKTTFETEYWEGRFFKKGTVHLRPRRQDLIDAANKLIAEHFGETLAGPPGSAQRDYTPQSGEPSPMKVGDDVLDVLRKSRSDGVLFYLPPGDRLERKLFLRVNAVLEAAGGEWHRKFAAYEFEEDCADIIEAIIQTGEVMRPQDLGQFDTPAELAAKVVDMAEIEPGMMVLEPSAGIGNLVLEIEKRGGEVAAVETDDKRATTCAERCSLRYGLSRSNFMRHPIERAFDRVVMNPPFAKSADIHHVMHAFDFVKPGGRLVAIMSGGAPTRSGRLADQLRALVEKHGGEFKPLPDGSFKAAGTMVRTVALILDKIA